MKKQPITGEAVRRALGTAPDPLRDDMRQTLAHLQEEKPVKRMTTRAAIITAALILLLTGMALAAANSLGVFDFLSKGDPLPAELATLVQTEFAQTGGDMDELTVTVRDAVSDGIGVFMTVEFKAKNPDDIVLIDFDTAPDRDESISNSRSPAWDQMREDQHRICVGGTWPYLATAYDPDNLQGNIDIGSGNDWMYEGTDTLLVHYIIDLRTLNWQEDTLPLLLCPFTIDTTDPAYWEEIDTADITVDVRIGSMESITLRSDAPEMIDTFTIESVEQVLTPLATYQKVVYYDQPFSGGDPMVDMEARQQMEDHYNRAFNLYFSPTSADGEPYPRLSPGLVYTDDWEGDDPYIHRDVSIFTAMPQVPDAVTLLGRYVDTGNHLGTATIPLHRAD